MSSFSGIIHDVKQVRGEWTVTLIRPEHVSPPAVSNVVKFDDPKLVEFFNNNKGWYITGSTDVEGYLATIQKEW